MRAIILLFALSGCACVSVELPRVSYVIPDEVRSCPRTAMVPIPPPTVRTAARLAQFATDEELSREATLRDLADCDRRRALAVQILDAR